MPPDLRLFTCDETVSKVMQILIFIPVFFETLVFLAAPGRCLTTGLPVTTMIRVNV
jgi:hypothetical protein